jgi:hypothetical protein
MPPPDIGVMKFTLIADPWMPEVVLDQQTQRMVPYVVVDVTVIRTHPSNYNIIERGLKQLQVELSEGKITHEMP